jgi:3-oxoacyl-[acyl-carrier protein] reductase
MALMLEGKVAVVTGAAGTLGLAAARVLLEDGARVALVDRDALRLDTLSRFLRGNTIAIAIDVADPAAVRQAHDRVRADLGAVDILVNAAGASAGHTIAATDEAAWRRVLATRLDGTYLWCRSVLPDMAARGWGRIVNVCGIEGGRDAAGPAGATAAGGLAALTAALAREAAAQGITVNAIAPAFVSSPATTDQLAEARRRQLLASIPAGRFGDPEEFGHAVRFLVSPMAAYVTGEVLNVDGGLHLG